jgi:hypothetical protein
MHSSHYGQQVTAPRLEHTRKVVALGQQQVSGHCCIKRLDPPVRLRRGGWRIGAEALDLGGWDLSRVRPTEFEGHLRGASLSYRCGGVREVR